MDRGQPPLIGLLTGNGQGCPVAGSYTFEKRGVRVPLPPDLAGRQAGRAAGIGFDEGALTTGGEATVGWRSATVGEEGVDIRIELGSTCFVDRVVADELVIRLTSFQRDIVLRSLELWGAVADEPRVFPVPRRLEAGFEVILGNCYSSHFTRFPARSAKPGVIGSQVSVWGQTNEEDTGLLGKLYDFIYAANGSWSTTCQDELRWTFDRRINRLMPHVRAGLRGTRRLADRQGIGFLPLDTGAAAQAPRRDDCGLKGGYDLSDLPVGTVELQGVPFQCGENVIVVESDDVRPRRHAGQARVPVGRRVAGLVFLHTCTAMGPLTESLGRREPIARYQVEYADGGTAQIDVAYGDQVAEWNRRHGAPLGATTHRHAGYIATYPVDACWQGKTSRGEDVTVYGLEWTNPAPCRPIAAVRIAASEVSTDASLVVVAMTAAVIEEAEE